MPLLFRPTTFLVETNKLANVLLDGGQSMLERALIVVAMDRVQLHIVHLVMVEFMAFDQYLTSFCSV